MLERNTCRVCPVDVVRKLGGVDDQEVGKEAEQHFDKALGLNSCLRVKVWPSSLHYMIDFHFDRNQCCNRKSSDPLCEFCDAL
ncbi:hypothetical protein GJAV_G00007940 [Gymnothorax javanicus]|nr:hypothetical protein GJAV_G00007940 [Gymnothorax javanicus]